MIVTLRLGESLPGNNGKSTLLNAILKSKYMFSCLGERKARALKPLTLDGCVEFIYLTKETASEELWNTFLAKYYKDGGDLLLLANLHGNALEFEDILVFLKSIATSFILFLMPNVQIIENLNYDQVQKSNIKKVKQILDSENISYVLVDSDPKSKFIKFSDANMNFLATDNHENLKELIHVLKKSTNFLTKEINGFELKDSVKMADVIATKQSDNFVKFLENKPWKKLKNEKLQIEEMQKKIISLMRDILLLDKELRLIAMAHLDRELNRISSKNSESARNNYIECYKKLKSVPPNDKKSKEKYSTLLNQYRQEIDDNNLGLVHIFREIGRVYEYFTSKYINNNPYWNAPNLYAELLVAGHAIELLDGDSSSITGSWLSAICNHINNLKPGLRVFVISILGLQSSGKSTLLNALFGCKFAVSVGRCTKGLFMRLLFLEENIKNEMNLDAILLIDSEGLEALEKICEDNAGKKDRSMATLAMGISHLTIVNVKGENMTSLTDILQISLVAMTRLLIADISPDILIVQHLDKKDDKKLAKARSDFNEALNKAFELINEDNNINIGVINPDCLNKLRQTIESEEFFKSFGPFKDGSNVNSPPSDEYHKDIVKLYDDILEIARRNSRRISFEQWPIMVQNVWNSVKAEDFMSFKGAMGLSEYLVIERLESKVKESIVLAFSKHHDKLLEEYILNGYDGITENIIEHKLAENIFISCTDKNCLECQNFISNQNVLLERLKTKANSHRVINNVEKYIKEILRKKVKSLLTIVEGNKTKEVENKDVLEKINQELRKELDNKKEGNYTSQEIEVITKRIFGAIKDEKSQNNQLENIEELISKEIKKVYNLNQNFVENHAKNPVKSLDAQTFQSNVFTRGWDYLSGKKDNLDNDQTEKIKNLFHKLGQTLLSEMNAKKFEDGMIGILKDRIESTMKTFESINDCKLTENLRINLISFFYHTFESEMKEKQKEWNKENNPLTIFCDKEEKYRDLIEKRLKLGFDFNNEGTFAGDSLVGAIFSVALRKANEFKILKIKDIYWIENTQTVRLKYFSQLINQVEEGNYENALNHFEKPKISFENWFKSEIDGPKLYFKETLNKYKLEFKTECENVIKEINDKKSTDDIRKYITDYTKLNKAFNYIEGNDSSYSEEADHQNLEHFRERIIKCINECEKETSEKSEYNLNFIKGSEVSTIWERIGCTYSCPLCSALCWKTHDHFKEENVDEDEKNDELDSQKHHSSHQPMGLSGTHYKSKYPSEATKRTEKSLCAEACHQQKNDTICWYNEKRIKWSEVKALPRYSDWLYGIHHEKKFDDMMKWFFYKLHVKIAERRSLKPADSEELTKYGIVPLHFTDWHLYEIKAIVNQTIGKKTRLPQITMG
jgi:GTPase Era involved in 16S rRNA processing